MKTKQEEQLEQLLLSSTGFQIPYDGVFALALISL